MKSSGGDVNQLKPPGTGDTQVIDLADVDLSDVDLSGSEPPPSAPRGTAPPPLPVLPPVSTSVSPSRPPPAVAEPSAAGGQRSTGFYVGVLVACLALSLVVGFGIAASLRKGEPTAATPPAATQPSAAAAPPTATASAQPSAESAPRVITIAPVEVE